MSEEMIFPCGYNPVVLGSVVDGDEKLLVEVGNLLYGDITMGNLVQLETFHNCETPALAEMYDKYKDRIGWATNMYFIDTDALSGTIYACGHSKRGEWTVFAKTAGYA
ncbi:hypothetical protein [Streptococcus halichoeri]|uniref:hypothetical protein n=1 Tax=Streptococcus halichoeri TaxID=254785 RepID=UPI0013577555|nr:hypothetical protein [Streptococcus halichoeri]